MAALGDGLFYFCVVLFYISGYSFFSYHKHPLFCNQQEELKYQGWNVSHIMTKDQMFLIQRAGQRK